MTQPDRSSATQFINTRDALVTEAIDGLLCTRGGSLARLDGYPHIKVVVRGDWQQDRVALISGGGSGHEPAHAGFVGQGMLSAAVCGEVFASPSMEAVLAGILAVTGEPGCLLIVKNYTGDRLNFGLAAERARALGLKVEMVIVDDDIALPELPQPRGVAGTLFVHKIAGALAEAGESLTTVAEAARQVVGKTVTLGMSLDTCTVPGSPKEERIPAGKAELGLGIHGEPGVEQVTFTGARDAMRQVAQRLATSAADGPYVALLNNLGGLMPLEMAILTKALAECPLASDIQWLVGPSPMMTSLDMRGFSLSLLPLSDAEGEALHAPTTVSSWPALQAITAVPVQPLPDALQPPSFQASADADREALIRQCCSLLEDAEADLNALDAKSGDGDTGATLASAARALESALPRLPLADTAELLRAIGSELAQSMGGSSGVLLAIFFSAAGDASAGGSGGVASLQAGLARISEVGGAKRGDRTMIDALEPALAALGNGMPAAASAARTGADHTASMTSAKAGRASYVSAQQLDGHRDPGAEAVARLFEGLAAG